MVVIATFGVSEAGIPTIGEMSLMPVTPQWLPIEDSFERQLVERLVAEGRAFIKGLRYNLHRGQSFATATLTDTGDAGSMMFVVPQGLEGTAVADGINGANPRSDGPVWVWQPATEAMPRFLSPARRRGNWLAAPTPTPCHLETDTEAT
jgi:hypothetical protein